MCVAAFKVSVDFSKFRSFEWSLKYYNCAGCVWFIFHSRYLHYVFKLGVFILWVWQWIILLHLLIKLCFIVFLQVHRRVASQFRWFFQCQSTRVFLSNLNLLGWCILRWVFSLLIYCESGFWTNFNVAVLTYFPNISHVNLSIK